MKVLVISMSDYDTHYVSCVLPEDALDAYIKSYREQVVIMANGSRYCSDNDYKISAADVNITIINGTVTYIYELPDSPGKNYISFNYSYHEVGVEQFLLI